MADLSMLGTRRERRAAEARAARQGEDDRQLSIEEQLPRLLSDTAPRLTEESVFDPRVIDAAAFDELVDTPPPEVVTLERSRPATIWLEWRHRMFMELLRAPLMIPIWWCGMQVCDVVWKVR